MGFRDGRSRCVASAACAAGGMSPMQAPARSFALQDPTKEPKNQPTRTHKEPKTVREPVAREDPARG
jgi:hypothetical protein